MPDTRRTALRLLATAAIAIPFASHAARQGRDRIETIGLQLYTVRRALQDAFESALDRVAAIGYREVEFAGYFDRTPRQVRDSLKLAGLTAPSAHVSLATLTRDLPDTLEAAQTVGHRYLVLGWIEAAERRSLDDYLRIADALNAAAERSRAAGIRIGYHNHDFEFAALEDRIPYDVLLQHTDAQVCFELDLYWISKAGIDPVAYMKKWPGRFPLVHVKDSGGPPDHPMTDVGSGSLDWRRIFSLNREAGIRHYFVEHDSPADPFASIKASYRYLRGLRI